MPEVQELLRTSSSPIAVALRSNLLAQHLFSDPNVALLDLLGDVASAARAEGLPVVEASYDLVRGGATRSTTGFEVRRLDGGGGGTCALVVIPLNTRSECTLGDDVGAVMVIGYPRQSLIDPRLMLPPARRSEGPLILVNVTVFADRSSPILPPTIRKTFYEVWVVQQAGSWQVDHIMSGRLVDQGPIH